MGKSEELAALKRQTEDKSQGRLTSDHKDRLKKIAKRKFNTCFISAISEFEQSFGVLLWGHGLSEEDLSNEQRTNRVLWNQVRKHILDKGNAQARALCSEIDLYDIKFVGYRIDFGERNDGTKA